MKRSRLTNNQILSILNQAENGVPIAELCREHGMSNATFYNWGAKFAEMDASMMSRLKELEEENRRQWINNYERPNMGLGGFTPRQHLAKLQLGTE